MQRYSQEIRNGFNQLGYQYASGDHVFDDEPMEFILALDRFCPELLEEFADGYSDAHKQ